MLVGSMALLATPYLTAFYSKDLIIELAFSRYSWSGSYAFILGTVTAGLTAFYSFRLLSLVFLTVPNGPKVSYLSLSGATTHPQHPSLSPSQQVEEGASHAGAGGVEVNLGVMIPLFVLSLFSIGFGYLVSDLYAGVGSDFLGNSIFIHPNNISLVEAEFSMSPIVKLLPLIFTIIGASSAFFIYNFLPNIPIDLTETSLGRKFYTFLNGKYLFDVIYNNYIIGVGLQLGYLISKVLDRGVIELLGPYGLANTFTNIGFNISKLDTGIVTTYGLYIVTSLLALIYIVFGSVLFEFNVIESRLLIVFIFTLGFLLFPFAEYKN
jgi:NADH-ubiquinone oxidoreductase chain 5